MNQVHNLTVLIAASEQLDTLALTYTLNDFGINNITTSSNQEDDVVREVLKNDVKTIFLDVLNSELPESKQVVQRLIQRTGCQVIAIGHSTEIFAYRGMLASGASDYLVNPVTPQDLEHVSFAALQLNNEKRNEKIVSIVSAKGGSGSSTIIATLSQQLAELDKRVTCMDLDFSMGDLDLLLNVEGNTALVELLQYPERLEPLVFERSGISVSPEHTLFTGYLPLDTTPFWPQKSAFDQFTKFCLQSSDYLLIDIPTYSLRDQVGFEALKSADIRIIVVEPTLSSIRNAGQIIKRLQNQAASQTIVVLNHCKSDSASLISAHDVKKSLGTSVDVMIPFLPNHFLSKSSLGQPAHKGNRKVKLAFNSLLELVTGEPQQGNRRFLEARRIMFGQNTQAIDPIVTNRARSHEALSSTPSVREHYHVIHEEVIKAIDPSVVVSLSAPDLEARIAEMVSDIVVSKQLPLGHKDVAHSVEQLLNEFLGLGPLQPLIEDQGITDIMVNGYREVYVERSGKLQKTAVQFRNEEQLLNLARRIVSKVGRRIDESNPLVDARLDDGSRVNVMIPPLALDGTYISIRKFNENKLTLSQLAQFGAMSKSMVKLIDIIVRSRLNVLVAGGTGAGKTTLLNAMSFSISPQERIITIEDTAELRLQQPHVVRAETRPANAEGLTPITQRELVRNSLRMRPDRIILGEVRGDEAFEMMQAMNTGHDGSLCTLHANSATDALVRMENMLMMSQATLPLFSLRRQIADTIDVVIQVERMRDGKRRIVSITEVQGLEGEQYITQDLFKFKPLSEDQQGNLIGEYKSAKCVPSFNEKAKYHQLDAQLRVAMELEA